MRCEDVTMKTFEQSSAGLIPAAIALSFNLRQFFFFMLIVPKIEGRYSFREMITTAKVFIQQLKIEVIMSTMSVDLICKYLSNKLSKVITVVCLVDT